MVSSTPDFSGAPSACTSSVYPTLSSLHRARLWWQNSSRTHFLSTTFQHYWIQKSIILVFDLCPSSGTLRKLNLYLQLDVSGYNAGTACVNTILLIPRPCMAGSLHMFETDHSGLLVTLRLLAFSLVFRFVEGVRCFIFLFLLQIVGWLSPL